MLSVREIQKEDIDHILNYWYGLTQQQLLAMGADINKLFPREEWKEMLAKQIELPYDQKKSYCIIWLVDGKPVGHSNINDIKFGESAYMHLHMWNNVTRKKGMGTELVKKTIPYFFKNCQLKTLYCEPYAHNPAPNKTLEKLGFKFLKTHLSIPSAICSEQQTNVWEIKL